MGWDVLQSIWIKVGVTDQLFHPVKNHLLFEISVATRRCSTRGCSINSSNIWGIVLNTAKTAINKTETKVYAHMKTDNKQMTNILISGDFKSLKNKNKRREGVSMNQNASWDSVRVVAKEGLSEVSFEKKRVRGGLPDINILTTHVLSTSAPQGS